MRTIIFILIQLFLLGVNEIKADVEGAPYHYPVSITLKDSTILKGYIVWSPDWDWDPTQLDTNFQNCNFCHNLFYKYVPSPDSIIVLYKNLIKTNENFPFEGCAVTNNSIDTIQLKRILKIEIESYEEIYYSGGVFTINADQIELVKSAPNDYYMTEDFEDDLVATYFLSFNEAINKDELKKISYTNYIRRLDELREKKILIINYYYAGM